MADVSDRDLLRDYARQGSEEAFAALVRRHISFVHSAALRHVGISTHAEEITQVVFVILARKAAGLRPDTILEGWLYETTRLTSLSFIRGERRRQFREQEAYMQSTLEESPDPSVWNQLAPLLDEAMSRLARKDRDAVILRFFKDKSLREVATALRVNEAAAQRRVLRAVEKLRLFFTRRGIVLSAAVLIAAISANSVQAAPAALAKTATAVAFAKGAMASGSGLTLIQGALKAMAWTKAKTGIVVVIAILATGTTGIVAKKLIARPTDRSGRLLDGSRVVLEDVTFGRTHVSPTGKLPAPLRLLPAKWLRGLKWNPGTPRTSNQETDMFVFWLQFSNSKGDESVRYAIADENGDEAPAVFNGPYWNYDSAGFGTNRVGQARSFGLIPRRSKRFYLRLYQQNKDRRPVRVANFPIENIPVTAVPGWVPSPLPVLQETNGLGFTLEQAMVGILPRERLVPPYDSMLGEWSEFRFRVSDHGKQSSGWNVSEIWIYDATGNQVRTSKEDFWSLNGTFSRIEDDEIICVHRWGFWPGEPAWKLRVRFEHEIKGEFWAEYFIKPKVLRAGDNRTF